MVVSYAGDLKKDENSLNQVFWTKRACAAVVWNEKTKELVRFEPCWNEEAIPSYSGNGKAKGVAVFKRGKQTCFRSTGEVVTFTEFLDTNPGQLRGKLIKTVRRLTVKNPSSACYSESGL